MKKGKDTVKYLFNKNNFIIYTELNKKYNKLFPIICKTTYRTPCKWGSAFYKYSHTARGEPTSVLRKDSNCVPPTLVSVPAKGCFGNADNLMEPQSMLCYKIK